VVVTSFTVDLGADSDYIAVDPGAKENSTNAYGGSAPSAVSIITNLISAANPKAGALIGGAIDIGQAVKGLAGGYQAQVENSGSSPQGGKTYVPTKSTMTVMLQPVYSRDSARSFSLDKFVNGDYIKSGQGFV
jgi:hypothetical protein